MVDDDDDDDEGGADVADSESTRIITPDIRSWRRAADTGGNCTRQFASKRGDGSARRLEEADTGVI